MIPFRVKPSNDTQIITKYIFWYISLLRESGGTKHIHS